MNAAGSTTSNSRAKSVSVKKHSTHTRLKTQAADTTYGSISGTKCPAPKDSDMESDVQKCVKHSRAAKSTTFARNERSNEDDTISNDGNDLYEDPSMIDPTVSNDDGNLYNDPEEVTTQTSEASSHDAANDVEYERIKAASKIDKEPRHKHNPRGRDNHTQDIRACFTVSKRLVEGVERDGHICDLCRKIGISEENSFFLGSNSSLRTHIHRNWSTHGDGYLNACKPENIEPNSRATHQTDDNGAGQTKLDGFVQCTPKWTRDGLKEYIVNWMITTDQAFEGVNHPTFRAMLKYQWPSTLESDIPHRTLVSEDVMYKAELVQFRIGHHFKASQDSL